MQDKCYVLQSAVLGIKCLLFVNMLVIISLCRNRTTFIPNSGNGVSVITVLNHLFFTRCSYDVNNIPQKCLLSLGK